MHSNWKKKVVTNFDTQAGSYDENSALQKRVARTLAAELPTLNKPEILEIGCGTGALTELLFEKYPNAHFDITDISENMLSQTKTDRLHTNWFLMDGENPNANKHYDLIIANMVFQWFEDKGKALGNLKKHLKPTGQILYSVPSGKSFTEWHDTLESLGLKPNKLEDFPWPHIIKEEDIKIDYTNTVSFLKSLKKTGAHTPAQDYKMLCPADLKRACAENDKRHSGKATWHILYGKIID